MKQHNDHVEVSEVEATGASKEGVVRWVLLGGLLLAAVLLSVTWIVPAMMQGDVEEEATVSGVIESYEDEADDDQTDSIVGAAEPEAGDETEIGENEVRREDGLSIIEN